MYNNNNYDNNNYQRGPYGDPYTEIMEAIAAGERAHQSLCNAEQALKSAGN